MITSETLRRQQEALPIFDFRDQLLDAIQSNNVLVVIGETGSGKTTQLPRYIAEEFRDKRIGVTQPRRIAATSVAKRVAEEYGCRLGDTVGYTIRFDDKTSSRTRLKYMTDGVLLREATLDPLLEHYDLLVIDEAHERTVETDVLFGLLKRTRARRPGLKLIVMSATLNVTKFSDFFDECPIFTIPGRVYPVDILHSKDNKKLSQLKADYVSKCVDTVMHILRKEVRPHEAGDILVFLTGQAEIERACKDLEKQILEHEGQHAKKILDRLQILPLYASMEMIDQATIFGRTPEGCRKVIFATNIAQTSVTIPNIRFVVDSGFVKQKMYDVMTGMDALLVVPISRAAATQRAGRAGRTRHGVCFRMYSLEAFETEMEEETVPEIMRTGLSGTVLSLKSLGIVDINGFEFLDRPHQNELMAALRELYLIDAIDRYGQMTDVGTEMVQYPVNPLLARVLVEAERLGCMDKIVTIVAMLSVEDVFFMPRKEEDQVSATAAHEQFFHHSGDHMTLLNVYEDWRKTNYSKEWCHDNFMNLRNLRLAKNVRGQLLDIFDRRKQRKQLDYKERETSSRTVLQAITHGYAPHLSKKHHHRQLFYHYLASSSSSSSLSSSRSSVFKSASAASNSLLALHVSSLSALYLDEERLGTKHGRKVDRDLEWIVYHEVVYHTRAVMRYASKVDHRWAQSCIDRAKLFDGGEVWLNGERTKDARDVKDSSNDDKSRKRPAAELSQLPTITAKESDGVATEDAEQLKKKARLEAIEAARQRALQRRMQA
ncbi:DEAH-box ATP-dependent RNA helicase prp22 [Actinomortierella ambigua]|nr:DEAH-box ATP-dependent RNA helicase prp22 [Actinomortierella ambigua]